MSLSFEELAEVIKEGEKMNKRVKKLIGFNPTTCNHYGSIQLYNQRINSKTTDEEIIGIRSEYLRWKDNIFAIFEEIGFFPTDEQFDEMFCVDFMYGALYFLDVPVNIYGDIEVYRTNILEYIKNR